MERSPSKDVLFEEEIRPSALMIDKAPVVEADRNFLLEHRSEWVRVFCPACQTSENKFAGEKYGFRYMRCNSCGTIYTCPRPSQRLCHAFYSQSLNYSYWNQHIFPATEEIRRSNIFHPRAERLLEYCRKYQIHTNTFLEVGAAFGTFCEEMRSANIFERVIALEPTADLARTCRERQLEVIELPIEELTDQGFVDVLAAF